MSTTHNVPQEHMLHPVSAINIFLVRASVSSLLATTAVQALASAAPEAGALFVSGNSIESQLLSSLAVRPVGLDQVEARLAVADPALFREYQVSVGYFNCMDL